MLQTIHTFVNIGKWREEKRKKNKKSWFKDSILISRSLTIFISFQRCVIVEKLLDSSNFKQFQFIWTVIQPAMHRDFMYTAKKEFPEINFLPISTHVSRKLRVSCVYLTWGRWTPGNNIESKPDAALIRLLLTSILTLTLIVLLVFVVFAVPHLLSFFFFRLCLDILFNVILKVFSYAIHMSDNRKYTSYCSLHM